jgi:TonB family protein
MSLLSIILILLLQRGFLPALPRNNILIQNTMVMEKGINKTGFIRVRGITARGWLGIIIAALVVHMAIFLFFKLEYLEVFRTEPPGEEGTSDFVYIDRPFSLVPYPDFPQAVIVEEQHSDIEEEEHERSVLDDLGEPSLTIDPIQSGRRSGGSDGRPGPRRTTVEPKPINISLPTIPDDIDGEIRGGVELLLYVNTNGEVEEIRVARGMSHESLNRTAIAAARSYKFIPGEIKGVPTSMWVRVTIGFRPR